MLGKVFENKYNKAYGSYWRADFKAMKDQCSKKDSSVVSDKTTNHESEGDDSGTDDVDTDDDIYDS